MVINFTTFNHATITFMTNSENLPVCNLDYLNSLSGGNSEFEESMMKLYLNLTPIELDKISTGLDNQDYEIIKNGAHKLISSVGVLGITQMKQRLVEIEKLALAQAQFNQIVLLFSEVKEIHAKAEVELKAFLKQ